MRDWNRFSIKKISRLFLVDAENYRKNAHESFEEMKNEVLPVLRDKYGKVILGYFDFRSCIESKIQNISFAEARKKIVFEKKKKN